MHKWILGMVAIGVFLPVAQAEYFDKRFEPGYELLEQGKFDQALETFEQLKTDYPDSELIDYSIATVFYKKAIASQDKEAEMPREPQQEMNFGMAELRKLDPKSQKVKDEFSKAKQHFELIGSTENDFLREHAPLNAANCSTQIAKLYNPQLQYKERVDALTRALNEYDAYLGLFPDQEVAQRNRDHVSYLLKELLRNPPEEEEQQDNEDENSDDNEDQQDQEQEDSSDEENPSDNEDEQEDNQSEDDEQEEGEDESEQSSSSSENESESTEQQESENGKSPEEQNMEAILESLEAKNQEEQKNLRRSKNAPRVKGGKWW